MSKCDELRKLLLEWGEGNYLPLKKKLRIWKMKIIV